jgi:hypothetical protein
MSITGLQTCPECKRTITIKSYATNVIICPHCYAPVQKLERYLKERINLVIAKDDLTPIQIGTHGKWNDKKFEIIGRVRCVYSEGFTNNWTMLFDDDTIMMLVEDCGEFAVYEKVAMENNVYFSRVAHMDYGADTVELNPGKQYILERKSVCTDMEVEGETWLFDDNRKFNCLEVGGQGAGRYVLIETGKKDYITFKIHYHSLAELECKELRKLQVGAIIKEVTCTNCKATVPLYAWPFTNSYTCTVCGGSHTLKGLDSKYSRRMPLNRNPAIPLYTRGSIRGTEYQLIGFAEKEDDESYKWREYTLFNPTSGYAYLSEYNGHWLFLKETANAPIVKSHNTMAFIYGNNTFRLYNQYRYSVVDCRGEFADDMFDEAKPSCREYIDPPLLWAREIDANGMYWFYGSHISKNELYDAFGKDISLPFTVGVGSVQPAIANLNVDFNVILRSTLGVLLLVLALFLFSSMFNRQEVIYENNFSLPDSTILAPIITTDVKLDKWRSNIDFEIMAPVDNNWFELGIALVNKDNGKEYNVQQGVEKYSGYSDGESWSEGSNTETVMMHSVPAGNYFMRLEPAKGTGSVSYFRLIATYDVPIWRNFFIFVLFALLPLGGLLIMVMVREGRRWQNSPFTHTN